MTSGLAKGKQTPLLTTSAYVPFGCKPLSHPPRLALGCFRFPSAGCIPAQEMLSRTSKRNVRSRSLCPNPKRISEAQTGALPEAIRTTKRETIVRVWRAASFPTVFRLLLTQPRALRILLESSTAQITCRVGNYPPRLFMLGGKGPVDQPKVGPLLVSYHVTLTTCSLARDQTQFTLQSTIPRRINSNTTGNKPYK